VRHVLYHSPVRVGGAIQRGEGDTQHRAIEGRMQTSGTGGILVPPVGAVSVSYRLSKCLRNSPRFLEPESGMPGLGGSIFLIRGGYLQGSGRAE
jgi:hypothetical protein